MSWLPEMAPGARRLSRAQTRKASRAMLTSRRIENGVLTGWDGESSPLEIKTLEDGDAIGRFSPLSMHSKPCTSRPRPAPTESAWMPGTFSCSCFPTKRAEYQCRKLELPSHTSIHGGLDLSACEMSWFLDFISTRIQMVGCLVWVPRRGPAQRNFDSRISTR